jgi:hypothetical protein
VALFAQLHEKYWDHPVFPSRGSVIQYKDLLVAQSLETLDLEGVAFGGLFGEGRWDPPLGGR